jgi:hypothetical protein
VRKGVRRIMSGAEESVEDDVRIIGCTVECGKIVQYSSAGEKMLSRTRMK